MILKVFLFTVSLLIASTYCKVQRAKECLQLTHLLNGDVGPTTFYVNFTFYNDESVSFDFDSPKSTVNIQEAHLFISNETFIIAELEVQLGKESLLKMYSAPHMLTKVYKTGSVSNMNMKGSIHLISKYIPKSPTRVSAAALVPLSNNKTGFLSYYSLNNAAISIPDLMVVERYKRIGQEF